MRSCGQRLTLLSFAVAICCCCGDMTRSTAPPPTDTAPAKPGTQPPTSGSPPPPSSTVPPPAPAVVGRTDPPHPAEEDPFAALNAQFTQLKSAAAVLRAQPETVALGQNVNVVLRVSPVASELELLQRMQTPDSVVAKGPAQIAPRMTAHLSAPGATITIDGFEEKAVRDSGDTEWRWNVSPGREGPLPIHVALTAPVIVGGKETPYEVRTFDATVTVIVAPTTRVATFIANNWQWLWTTILVPAALWMLRSRRKSGGRRRGR